MAKDSRFFRAENDFPKARGHYRFAAALRLEKIRPASTDPQGFGM